MFQKYGGREPTSSLGTEPPFYEFEEPTTVKSHHKQRMHHPVTETTRATRTSPTTKTHLIRLVALETTEAIKPMNFTTRPATTTATTTTPTATTATTTTSTTTATTTTTTSATITTPDLTTTTERPVQQRKDSIDFTTHATTSSRENYLKQQIMFISSAVTTEKSWTQSEQYDMTTKAVKRPLLRLVERTTTTSATPVSSLDTEQPLSTTTEKTSTHMEGTSEDEFGRVTSTQTKQMEYAVPHVKLSEQPSSATSDLPVHWQLRTTISMLTTDPPDATQHLEYKTTPNLSQPEPETTSTTEALLFKYKTTLNLVQPEPETTSTTEAPLFKYKTTPTLGQPEPETTSTTEAPLFTYKTTPTLVQPEPETTSTTEAPLFPNKTTPTLAQPEPETTSTTEAPLFKYKTTDFIHSAESTEMTFITEHSQPEDQATRHHLIQWLNNGKQSTDTVTSSTLYSGTDYSASFPESVTSTTIFETGGISDHSESKTGTEIKPISISGTRITETEDPMENLTTPATKLSNIISPTDSTSVNNQSVFTTNNVSTASHTSTAASTQSAIGSSTAPYNATFDTTDVESTTSTNLLTSSSSSSPDIQPIYTLVITDTSSDSTATTSDTGGTDATDSSVSGIGDLSSQSVSAVPLTDVSRFLNTTDEPLRISVTGPTTAAVTTWHSPTASDETSMMSLLCKSREIIADATVAPGWLLS